MRADARRNRQRVFDAARELFATPDSDPSMEQIARAAGRGRRHDVPQLAEPFRARGGDLPRRPRRAPHRWPSAITPSKNRGRRSRSGCATTSRHVQTKRGMLAELGAAFDARPDLLTDSRRRVLDAAAIVLEPARAAGVVRADLTEADVVQLVRGMVLPGVTPPERYPFLLEIVLAGMRVRSDDRRDDDSLSLTAWQTRRSGRLHADPEGAHHPGATFEPSSRRSHSVIWRAVRASRCAVRGLAGRVVLRAAGRCPALPDARPARASTRPQFVVRRRRGLPDGWLDIVERNVAMWSLLTRRRARPGGSRRANGCCGASTGRPANGFVLTDEIIVTIAVQAALLVLGLSTDEYREVGAIIVYPSAMKSRGVYAGPVPGTVTAEVVADPRRGARRPRPGAARVGRSRARRRAIPGAGTTSCSTSSRTSSTCATRSSTARLGWIAATSASGWTCAPRRSTRSATAIDRPPLQPYGATNPAEFFAVATEAFFDVPMLLEAHEPQLYEVLRHFFNQDPAHRARRAETEPEA